MKFRIYYRDGFMNEKTILYESSTIWTAIKFGESVFKDKYLRCEPEDNEPIEPDYSYHGETD